MQVDEVCFKNQGGILQTELAMTVFTRGIIKTHFTPHLPVHSLPRMEQLQPRLSDPDGAAPLTQAGSQQPVDDQQNWEGVLRGGWYRLCLPREARG